MENALLLFVKNPERGKVKTRLAATLGVDRALEIYHLLLKHTRKVALSIDADLLLFYGQYINENDDWPKEKFEKHLQHKGDLGERMHEAIRYALEDRNYSKAVLIGSDIAELTPEIVQQAFQHLSNHPFVLGPAKDGGYYLVGMTQPSPEVFLDMTWSTDSVLAETVKRMEKVGATPFLLPVLSDVDYAADWDRVKHRFE